MKQFLCQYNPTQKHTQISSSYPLIRKKTSSWRMNIILKYLTDLPLMSFPPWLLIFVKDVVMWKVIAHWQVFPKYSVIQAFHQSLNLI